MHTGTIIEYEDQSAQVALPITSVREQPLFAATFTSDKGEEAWALCSGEEFFKKYGNQISFAKHGQPLLQAAVSINAGARLFCKRVVAADSMMANAAIVAEVTTKQVQKLSPDGKPLYTDAGGKETVEVTANPVNIAKAVIKYSIKSATSVADLKAADDSIIADTKTPETWVLATLSEVGRGVSNKRFMILPEYALSKNLDYVMYNFAVLEGGNVVESIKFALDPARVEGNTNISLQSMIRTNSLQLKCVQHDAAIKAFMDKVCEISGIDAAVFAESDMLFGCNKKGVVLDTVEIDSTGINLQHPYGQSIANGSNGAFANAPMADTTYATEMVKAWDGTYSSEVFNVDKYKIDAVIDANYPKTVKRAIEKLVSFREDCTYFRDLGLGLNTMELILAADKDSLKNMFCATYHLSYDVADPYSKKQISVTAGYSLARLLVKRFNDSRSAPMAGIKYGMVIPEAIPGTVNFTPVVCPDADQKEILEDARINYASYIDEQLVFETLFTSQEKLTGFSYINNVLATQEVVKTIRTKCPASRYSFIDAAGLEAYKSEVNRIIEPFKSNFDTLTLEYVGDANYTAQKIFYAVIKVSFRDFVQTELFKVIALNNSNVPA